MTFLSKICRGSGVICDAVACMSTETVISIAFSWPRNSVMSVLSMVLSFRLVVGKVIASATPAVANGAA